VFLTHGHQDHVAGCDAFRASNIFVHGDEQPLLSGVERSRGPLTRWFPARDAGVRATWVDDDVNLRLGGSGIVGLHVPGHTSGSTAWLIDGVLFLGDSADGGAAGQLLPAAWLFTDDRELNIASLKRLAGRIKPSLLVFAHSGALPGEALLAATTL
jgi:glyoxylase-like metal-dependent hydrolase (beta-lactamase superfamily II)